MRRFIRPRLSTRTGDVLSGAWLHVYEAGTSTEVDLYAAQSGGSVLTQPRTSDAQGEVQVYLADATADVDLVWSDSGAVLFPNGLRTTLPTLTEFWQSPLPRAIDFIPELKTVDAGAGTPFAPPAHATPTDQSGLWGAPSYGWYTDDGFFVDGEFRMVMGTLIDAAFSPGLGYHGVTLPVAPTLNASNPMNGWLFGIAGDFSSFVKFSTQIFVDPPLSSLYGLISPDGATDWSTRDPLDVPPPGYVFPPDYPVPMGALYVVGGTYRYRRA